MSVAEWKSPIEKEDRQEFAEMSDLEQFAELGLTKEDHDQIFEPPTDRQQPQLQEAPYR